MTNNQAIFFIVFSIVMTYLISGWFMIGLLIVWACLLERWEAFKHEARYLGKVTSSTPEYKVVQYKGFTFNVYNK